MAWRNPRFCLLHAARAAGAAAISASTSFHADYPKEHLIDNRAGFLTKMGSVTTNHRIIMDRGAAGLEAIDRLIIPAGHNLNGCTISAESDDNSGFSSPITILSSVAISSAAIVDKALTSTTERYVRLTMATSGQWELPELIWTRTRTITVGTQPRWDDDLDQVVQEFRKQNGEVPLVIFGPSVREFVLEYRKISIAADLTFFADLLALGRRHPFYLDPAFDTESAVWVRLSRKPEGGHDEPNPFLGAEKKRFRLTMEQWLA